MTYNEQGHPIFKKLGPRATFANVCENACNMGYTLNIKSDKSDWVILSRYEGDQYTSRYIRMDEFIDFLNGQMVEREYIKEEPEL